MNTVALGPLKASTSSGSQNQSSHHRQ